MQMYDICIIYMRNRNCKSSCRIEMLSLIYVICEKNFYKRDDFNLRLDTAFKCCVSIKCCSNGVKRHSLNIFQSSSVIMHLCKYIRRSLSFVCFNLFRPALTLLTRVSVKIALLLIGWQHTHQPIRSHVRK